MATAPLSQGAISVNNIYGNFPNLGLTYDVNSLAQKILGKASGATTSLSEFWGTSPYTGWVYAQLTGSAGNFIIGYINGSQGNLGPIINPYNITVTQIVWTEFNNITRFVLSGNAKINGLNTIYFYCNPSFKISTVPTLSNVVSTLSSPYRIQFNWDSNNFWYSTSNDAFDFINNNGFYQPYTLYFE